jgi:hypothetical protein
VVAPLGSSTSSSSRGATSAVPADHSLRSDNHEVRLPRGWKDSADADPKKSITVAKARSGMGSQGNLQLVAQAEVFEDQFGVGSKDRADQAKDQLEEFDHRGRLAASSCEPLPSPNHRPTGGHGYSDLVLPPDTAPTAVITRPRSNLDQGRLG